MMNRNLSIDASVFLSALFQKEINSSCSRKFLQKIKELGFFVSIPLLTPMEVLQSYYRFTKNSKRSDDILEQFVEWNMQKRIGFVSIEASFFLQFTAHHRLFNLKTSDTIVAVNAYHQKTTLITWDKKLIQECKNKIPVMTPKQFLTQMHV